METEEEEGRIDAGTQVLTSVPSKIILARTHAPNKLLITYDDVRFC
jgi:hypothetical protein